MKMPFLKFILILAALFTFNQKIYTQCNFDLQIVGAFELCPGDCSDYFVEVFGGVAPYSFQWTTGETTQSIVTCDGGTFCVTVTDSNNNICESCIDVGFSNFFIDLVGPDCASPNNPGTVTAIPLGGFPSQGFYEWTTNDGLIIDGLGTSDITIASNGTYCVFAFDNQTGCTANACYTVNGGNAEPNIEVIAGLVCESQDSLLNACQKVCTNSTITYNVTNANGADVEWEVNGSDDFNVNGEQVTVTWGSAGFGEVTAIVGDPGTNNPVVSVDCGLLDYNPNSESGTIYVHINGSTGPLTGSVNGITFTFFNGINYIGDLEFGDYQIEVYDNDGNILGECQTEVVPIMVGQCNVETFATFTNPSDCNSCDGSILIDVYGAIEPIEFFWQGANGFSSTEEDISGLCEGTYTLFWQDVEGCSDSLDVTLSCSTQACFGESTVCVEILENPVADFTTDPPVTNGLLEICKGQTVQFFNQSTGASAIVWDFGDFTNSILDAPVHTYPTAGIYTVSLIAYNECFCADTTTLNVKVLDLELPEIKCTGTVCKGETVTYETEADCSGYNWNITGNATILDGGGNGDDFITVEWNEGPQGTVELTVNNCNPALCDATSIAVVPIITDDISVIEGPNKVCQNDVVQYFITDFGGADVTWSVTGGNITEGQGTNQITVEWLGSPTGNPYSVSVQYENCFLECGGSDQMAVNVRSQFYVEGPVELCQNQAADFTAVDATFNIGVNVNWTVVDASNTTVFTASGTSTNINWTFPVGEYTVVANPINSGNSCTPEYRLTVSLLELPPLPNAILGATDICQNTNYTYTADGLAGHEFHWIINNGGNISEDFGDNVNVVWGNNPPYILSLSQITPSGLQCESETISQTMSVISVMDISGNNQLCKEEIGSYSADSYENINYTWTISPPTAGIITNGENTAAINIQWNAAGPATISLDACGLSASFNVTVFDLPQPVVNHPALLCPFEMAPVSTTQAFTGYEWRDEFDQLVSTDPQPDLTPGYYEVIVTDVNGCTGNEIFNIDGYPEPNISISTPGELGLCPTGNAITLYALENSGGYDYQWFYENSPIGTNAPTVDITQTGSYWVVITDANGCTATSNTLLFRDCSDIPGASCINGLCVVTGSGNGPNCIDIGNIDFTWAQAANCNVIDFQNTSTDFIPGTLVWDFADPESGIDNTSTLENPSHTFTKPGFFKVLLRGDVVGTTGNCDDRVIIPVMVPAAADFKTDPGCIGEPIEFFDHSAFLPDQITAITNWQWDFGDPASGAANTSTDQNPIHTFPDDGNYTVTLTITTDNGCTSTVQKSVSVHPLPTISFNLPSVQCEMTAIDFMAIVDPQVTDVEWTFGDPASGEANTSERFNPFHIYDASGSYSVSVSARNIYGCTNDFDLVVPIIDNLLTGTITPNNPAPLCEGDNINLTAPAGGTSWIWSSGEITETINVTAEGIYGVTISDADGCTYSPADVAVEILPVPIGTIRAVEYNEFGQAINFVDDNYAVCEGEDVSLFAQTSTDYGFLWSTGDADQEISFTEDKGNLLVAGTYNYSVTITNNTTGCTAIAGPYEVVIHPAPNDVMIASSPGGPLCDGTAATITITNPDPMLTYAWNTGEIGNSIMAFAAGEYWVRAINAEGCEGESNRIKIESAPDINKIPSGYHIGCSPDTICLPDLPTVVSYQWYLEGVAIPAPAGTVADYIATESGEYTVEMTDMFGCVALSNPLCLELLDGFGTIEGSVYFDVNENGVIDGADTLVSNINFILIDDAGGFGDTQTSNSDGYFVYPNVLSLDYDVLLDAASLPPNWFAYSFLEDAPLVGCDDENEVNFLLYKDCTTSSRLDLGTCVGSNILYNGQNLVAGDSLEFTFPTGNNCDSIVTVVVSELPTYSENKAFFACQGTAYEYDGQMINAGDTGVFSYQTIDGCDSTITVKINEVIPYQNTINREICPDATTEFNGVTLAPGQTQDFVFQDQYGCDSTITIVVDAYNVIASNVILEACPGGTTTYNGQSLAAGVVQDFIFADQNGCDSTVTVQVMESVLSSSSLILEACPGGTTSYNGQSLSAGMVEDFIFADQNGCDSTVTVTVSEYALSSSSLNLEVCINETANYNGTSIAIGDTQDFILMDQNGCDSTITVIVSAYPEVSFNIQTDETCWNANDGRLEVIDIVGNTTNLAFSIDGVNYQNDPVFEGLSAGNYTVSVRDNNSCNYETVEQVVAIAALDIKTENAIIECNEPGTTLQPLVLNANPNDLDWAWSDGSTSPTLFAENSGTYTVDITNNCETIQREIEVNFGQDGRTQFFFVPNVFSPNDDGVNDKFQAYQSPNVEVLDFEIQVFNRWGSLVYQSENPTASWNGVYDGKSPKAGVYVVHVQSKLIVCGREVSERLEADVTIIK